MRRKPLVRLGTRLACAGLLTLTAGCGGGAADGIPAADGVPAPDGIPAADGVPAARTAGGEMTSTLAPEASGGDIAALVAAADLPPCPAPPAPAPAVEGGLPDIVLDCLGGGDPVRLSALRGPLLVNVWASWCGPCQAETPVLSAFANSPGERVPVLGVDVGDTRAGGLAAAARWGASFPSVQDPAESVKGAVRPSYVGPPATYLLHADGTLAPLILGEITGVEQIIAALAAQGIGSGPA